MLRRTTTTMSSSHYFLRNYAFPPQQSSVQKQSSVVWLAPCAKDFKLQALAAPKSTFVFHEGNKVEPSVFEHNPGQQESVVVVSAQKVTREFFEAWRKKVPTDELTLVRRGTSVDSIDRVAAAELKIRTLNTPGVNSPHVARYMHEVLQIPKPSSGPSATKTKVAVIGLGTVGAAFLSQLPPEVAPPVVVTSSSLALKSAFTTAEETTAGLAKMAQEKYPSSPASLSACLHDAFRDATHIAVCCPSAAEPLITREHIKTLLAGAAPRDISICCIARPDVFSVDAILEFLRAAPGGGDAKLSLLFDYGDAVLKPTRDKITEAMRSMSPEEADRVQSRVRWTTKAMHSEECNQDMDVAALNAINPELPRVLQLFENDQQQKSNAAPNDAAAAAATPAAGSGSGSGSGAAEQQTPNPVVEKTLATFGGPSAWMQSFVHLTKADTNRCLFFSPPAPGIWTTSGRQLSLREKVTKFTPLAAGVKNLQNVEEMDAETLKSLVMMGGTYLYERFASDAPHEEVLEHVTTSIARYRELNSFLASAGEPPVFYETGRVVIAGSESELKAGTPFSYEKVRAWRQEKELVDEEKSKVAADFLAKMSSSSSSSSSSLLLFNPGYSSYSLAQGGYLCADADQIIFRALKNKFPSRFRIVDSAVKTVIHNKSSTDRASYYTLSTADTNTFEAGRFYASPGATHVLINSGNASSDAEQSRLNPPIVITGLSGLVRQRISKQRREEILAAASCIQNVSSLKELLARCPAAFMTDDFECTIHNVEENNNSNGSSSILWRVTGGASINTDKCALNPESALIAPVKRFLAHDDADEEAQLVVEEPGFRHCTRICGPQFKEQITKFGSSNGVVGQSFGHWGVVLSGMDVFAVAK